MPTEHPAPKHEATSMPYSAEISRANPTCFLFLIDQSRSMLQPMAGAPGKTKAEAVADAINHLLYTLVLRCVWGNNVLDRFHVGVIGYGLHVSAALGGNLAGRDLVPIGELARNPLRVEQRPQPGDGGTAGQTIRFPIWFEPTADGNTPMCATLNRAGTLLAGFLVDHPDSFPPIVINITDGKANDGDPEPLAGRLKQLSSTDGGVLLFNLHLSEKSGERIEFPDQEASLPDPFARLLFRMSSPLPPALWAAAREKGLRAGPGTRGFVFNADLDSVIRSLDIGTRVDLSRGAR
jgi:hypothetical protein